MRRSGAKIMMQLIGLVRPLIHIMIAAIVLGTVGYLCAIFLTILAGYALLLGIEGQKVGTVLGILIVIAILRGILHYAEQYCNHFIAFKLLAIIRHKVFYALRKLCPAKLEGRDKGNLISIITTDIELLEVFYAHTISPIAIAILTCLIMLGFFSRFHIGIAIFAFVAYVTVGVVIPMINARFGKDVGMKFRTEFGGLNSFLLDSLRGLDETLQYDQGKKRQEELDTYSYELAKMQRKLSKLEGNQRCMTNIVILGFSFGMLFLTLYLKQQNQIGFDGMLLSTIAMMSSFGPVTALSNLSNNLNQTLASGERVLSILEEEPLVEEVEEGGKEVEKFTGANICDVTFSYEEETILSNYSFEIKPNRIIGIHGVSGSGKSTLLKLLMRFWDVNKGSIQISGEEIKNIKTRSLRNLQSYVTQETHLFHDSIANNIAIGKPNATMEEIIEASKKAAIHDFIMTLPKGYQTEVGELGDTLSGGQRQRIGIARAFLHDAPLWLLDEPTSNLDSLNEGIILKSLKESCKEKTMVLVSHRKSTMNIVDDIFEMSKGRIS